MRFHVLLIESYFLVNKLLHSIISTDENESNQLREKSMSQDSLYIIMPAYNEEESLPRVLDEWYAAIELSGCSDSRLVVINDGSIDGTQRVLEEYAETHPLFTQITKKNGGHGAAIYEGYRVALDARPRFVFQTDSDGQTDPGEFLSFWQKRYNYDVIMGERSSRKDGFSRILVTKVLKQAISLLLHAHLADANVPYRLMRYEALFDCFPLIPPYFNLTNIGLSAAFYRRGLKIKFIPISFNARKTGSNSINLKSIFSIGFHALSDFRALDKVLRDA